MQTKRLLPGMAWRVTQDWVLGVLRGKCWRTECPSAKRGTARLEGLRAHTHGCNATPRAAARTPAPFRPRRWRNVHVVRWMLLVVRCTLHGARSAGRHQTCAARRRGPDAAGISDRSVADRHCARRYSRQCWRRAALPLPCGAQARRRQDAMTCGQWWRMSAHKAPAGVPTGWAKAHSTLQYPPNGGHEMLQNDGGGGCRCVGRNCGTDIIGEVLSGDSRPRSSRELSLVAARLRMLKSRPSRAS